MIQPEVISVISKARELVQQHGKYHAIQYFQDRIKECGESNDFGIVCKRSGFETAIRYIDEKLCGCGELIDPNACGDYCSDCS